MHLIYVFMPQIMMAGGSPYILLKHKLLVYRLPKAAQSKHFLRLIHTRRSGLRIPQWTASTQR